MSENSTTRTTVLASPDDVTTIADVNVTRESVDDQPTSQSKVRVTRLVLLVTWCATLYGLSSIHWLDLGHFSGLCGRWGCLPATSSLLGMHLVWLLLLSTVAPVVVRWKPASRRWLIRGFFGCGLLLAFGMCVAAAIQWKPSISECRQLFPFSIISHVDFPAIQCLLVGVGLLLYGGSRKTTSDRRCITP